MLSPFDPINTIGKLSPGPILFQDSSNDDNKHGKASFHSLRSTFITNCEEAGISRTVIQGIVGHGSPHMTERYSEDKKSGRILKDMPSIK